MHAGAATSFALVAIADGAASTLPAQVGLAVASTVYRWGALWAMFDVADWPGQALLEQRYHATRRMFGLMPTARVGDKLRLSMYQLLSCALTPCFQADSNGLWRDLLFAAGLKLPGIQRLMVRSIATPGAKKQIPAGAVRALRRD